MRDALQTALELARAEFVKHLNVFGADATWRRRSDAVPDSGGSLSAAAGQGDPLDAGYVPTYDDTDLYQVFGEIKVMKDIPEDANFLKAGNLVSGEAFGYVRWDDEVVPEDVLVIGDERWKVVRSRVVTPAVYRELTIKLVDA